MNRIQRNSGVLCFKLFISQSIKCKRNSFHFFIFRRIHAKKVIALSAKIKRKQNSENKAMPRVAFNSNSVRLSPETVIDI